MYLGRHDRGSEVILVVSCENASGVVVFPDEAPTVEVFGPTGKVMTEGKMPAADGRGTPGLFRMTLFLGTTYAAGYYSAAVRYLLSGVSFSRMLYFEVTPSGDPNGTVVALYQYEKPDSRYLVHSTDAGKIFKGKNPRIPT